MTELLVVAALVLLNAFFALSEMALVTSRKSRLKQLAVDSRRARLALEMAEHPDNLLSTVQVGITLISVLTGLFGGESIGLAIAGWLRETWPEAVTYARAIGIGTAVGLITSAQVIFGELLPKRLALTDPERIAVNVALPLHWLSLAARPVVWLLGRINRALLRVLGIRSDQREAVSEEEIRMLVSESHEQGVIDRDERNMVNRVLQLGERDARSLMTPRVRITWLDAANGPDDNLATMRETPYSRYPVYRGNDSEVAGVLEVKGLLDQIGRGPLDLFRHLREPLFVSESTHALKLLEIFREEQQSLALVVDEYGDIQGMVTVNDLLGAVIGRIDDSAHAEGGATVIEREDGSLLVDGALPIGEFRERLGGLALPGEDEHDYNTVAGMVVAQFGRIPNAGEHFTWHRWRIEVVDLDGARVDKLLVERLPVDGDADDGSRNGD